jgi:predicted GIY-YIG superfamily endonuclease
MKNYEKNEKRQFTGTNNNAIAIALFKDENDEIRFFCNHYCQHMGIQPGMGLPVFAGTICYKGDKYVIDNNSGHYKPSFDIDVLGFIQSMNPKANVYERFCYQSELGSKGNAALTRIHNITGPEDYADLARGFRSGSRKDFYNYLKDHGYWDLIFSDSTVDKSLAWAREQIIKDLREEKLNDVARRSQGTQTDERSFTHWASSKDDSNKALWDGPKRGHFHKTYKAFSPAI